MGRLITAIFVLGVTACAGGSDVSGIAPPVAKPPTDTAVTPPTLKGLVLLGDSVHVTAGDTARVVVRGLMSDGSTKTGLTDLTATPTSGLIRASVLGDTVKFVADTSLTAYFFVSSGGKSARGIVSISMPLVRIRVSPSGVCSRQGFALPGFKVLSADSTGAVSTVAAPVQWNVMDTVAVSLRVTADSGAIVTANRTGKAEHTYLVAKVLGLTALSEIITDPAPIGTAMTCALP